MGFVQNSGPCFNINTFFLAVWISSYKDKIDGLVQERRNSSALAMELHLSCTNPSRWSYDHLIFIMEILILVRWYVYIRMAACVYNEDTIYFLILILFTFCIISWILFNRRRPNSLWSNITCCLSYNVNSIPFLLMPWWLKEPWH